MKTPSQPGKVWLVLTSPRAEDGPLVKKLCSQYPAVGVNALPAAFPWVDYWLFTCAQTFVNCFRGGYILPGHKIVVTPEVLPATRTGWYKKNGLEGEYLVRPYGILDNATGDPGKDAQYFVLRQGAVGFIGL